MTKTLRRIGLGSLTGIALYLLTVAAAFAVVGYYSSFLTIGGTDAWFTIGSSTPAWFTLGGLTEIVSNTYNIVAIGVSIIIALAIVVWEINYLFNTEGEIDVGMAALVLFGGILVIIVIQIAVNIL